MIPYGKQDINQDDIRDVVDVLNSDFLTQGPKVPLFESKVSKYVSAKYAIALNSATSALHVACLALGLKDGDFLWTSPNTFVASANCGLYCGAKIDFVDIDPISLNLCPRRLEEKLIKAEASNTLPKIVIPVHFSGQPCDMKSIFELSQKYGFKIIEDASHAIGGTYLNNPIGSGQYSHITVFSFHPVKIITTAEGGMAVTNSKSLALKMNLFRSHGVTRDESLMKNNSHGPWYYQQIELGYNYRMTELQAALGISQMGRLDNFIERRNSLADRYDSLLEHMPLLTPIQNNDGLSARHLYVVRLKLSEITKSKRYIFQYLRKNGIGVNVHYIPVHTQPYYLEMGFKYGDFKEAEKYYEEAISLPLYPNLNEHEQDKVIKLLNKVLCE